MSINKGLIFTLTTLPVIAIASDSIITEGKKITEKTEVYANGVLSSLIISNLSVYKGKDKELSRLNERLRQKQQEAGAISSLYKSTTKQKDDEINRLNKQLQLKQQETGKISSLYKSTTKQKDDEIDRLNKQLQLKQQETGVFSSLYQSAKKESIAYKDEIKFLQSKMRESLLLGDLVQNFYYVTASDELTKEQKDALSMVFKSLKGIKGAMVEITGRADPRGRKDYNQKLSQRRADKIKEIALESGLDSNKIKSIGIGEQGDIHKNPEYNFFERYSTVRIHQGE